MNALLKAVMKEAADAVKLGKDAVAKNWGQLLVDGVGAAEDVASIVSNIGDAKAELEALTNDPAASADLLAYAQSLVSGEDAAVQKIVAASAKAVLDAALIGVADVKGVIEAIKAVQAPAVAAAPAAAPAEAAPVAEAPAAAAEAEAPKA